MGYIPKDAKWYRAEIVEELRIEDEPQTVVHINTVLIQASLPEEAYDKAVELGRESNNSYENTDGKIVTVSFRGLRDLNVIHDELEHGAELMYEEEIGLTDEQIEQIVCQKDQLGVFLPISPSSGPNYMPKHIAEEILRRMKAPKESTNNAT